MRTLFNVAIIVVITATVWFGNHTIAKQNNGVSIDPYWISTHTTNLPMSPQWDLY